MGNDAIGKQHDNDVERDSFGDWLEHLGDDASQQTNANAKHDGAAKVPNGNTGKPKDAGQKPLNQGGATAPKPADKGVRSAAGAAILAPPTVQLGDIQLGKPAVIVEVPVFNLADFDHATIFAEVEGAPGVRVVSEPFTVLPHQAPSPGSSVKLEFRPTVVGRVHGNLRIQSSWRSGAPASEALVSIQGGAHAGEQTLDEQDAARAGEAKQAQDSATAQREREGVDKQIKGASNREKAPNFGHLNQLNNARDRAMIVLERLYRARHDAIAHADSIIGEFTRMIPPEHHSRLFDLAFAALDFASAGIAGGLAKSLEPALATILGTMGRAGGQIHYPNSPDNYTATGSRSVEAIAPMDASRAVVAIVSNGIKQMVKAGGTAVVGAIKGKDEGPTEKELHGGVSIEAKSAFLHAQRATLANSDEKQAHEVSEHAYNALLLGIDSAPDAMIATMNAVADALSTAKSTAGDIQLRETVTQWVRLVAQTSLGSVPTKSGAAVTALDRANAAPGLDQPLAPRDGLIDISFSGDDYDSSAPIQLTHARVNGITPGALDTLTGADGRMPARSIRDLGLAIRVSGMFSGNDSAVTVVRDEAGNIQYTDRSRTSHWFARRAGVMTHATDVDQHRGAREFLDRDILGKTLLMLPLKNDAKK